MSTQFSQGYIITKIPRRSCRPEACCAEIRVHAQDIFCVLPKPYDFNLLDDLLHKQELPEGLSKINLTSSLSLAEEDFDRLNPADSPLSSMTFGTAQGLTETYHRFQDRLLEEFPGVRIIVMKLNLASGQLEKNYAKGIDDAFIDVLLYDLRYSPIGGVLWKGNPFLTPPSAAC